MPFPGLLQVDWERGHPDMGSLCLLQLVCGMCQLLGSDCVFQFWMPKEDTLSIMSFMNGFRCVG